MRSAFFESKEVAAIKGFALAAGVAKEGRTKKKTSKGTGNRTVGRDYTDYRCIRTLMFGENDRLKNAKRSTAGRDGEGGEEIKDFRRGN